MAIISDDVLGATDFKAFVGLVLLRPERASELTGIPVNEVRRLIRRHGHGGTFAGDDYFAMSPDELLNCLRDRKGGVA